MKRLWWILVFAVLMIVLTSCTAPAPSQTAPAPLTPTPALQPTATTLPGPEPTSSNPIEQPTAITPPALPTQPPVESTPAASQPATPAASESTCFESVLFLTDVTFPDFSTLEPGKVFLKTWRVQNAGSCAWNARYQLVFLSGEPMTAQTRIPLPSVQPGATVDLSVQMTSPAGVGGYTSNWQFLDPAGRVIPLVATDQAYVWLKLNVAQPPPALVQNPAPVIPVSGPAPQPTPLTSPLPSNIPMNCVSSADDSFSGQVLALINNERTSRGLAPLTANTLLNAAARVQALDMSCNNFVEHYGSDGSTWFTRIKAQGYNYGFAAENIAAGNPAFGGSAAWVVQTQWMNSQVHRDNILNPNVTEIGVAYLFNSAAQWGGYTAVVFARP